MNRKKTILLTIVSFLLALSIGYALFSQTVNVSGTSIAQGSFDVQFYSATLSSHVGSTNETAVISNDHNSLDIAVPELAYPGASATFTVVVKNVGSIPAKLTGITSSGLTSDANIEITTNVNTLQNVVMSQNNTQSFTITVTWLSGSQQQSQNVNFSIGLTYTQATS